MDSDKSLRLRWEITEIVSGAKIPGNLIVSNVASSCQSLDVQLALSLLPVGLSAKDASNARIDLRIAVDLLNETAFMSLLRTGAIPQTYSDDLRAPDRFVMLEAVKISAVSISVVLNSRSAAQIKAALSSGSSGSGFAYQRSSNTSLTIRSQQDFYIVGKLSQMNAGAK